MTRSPRPPPPTTDRRAGARWLKRAGAAVMGAVLCGLVSMLAAERPPPARDPDPAIPTYIVRLRPQSASVEHPDGFWHVGLVAPVGRPLRIVVKDEGGGDGLLLPEQGLRVHAPDAVVFTPAEPGFTTIYPTGAGHDRPFELEALPAEEFDSPCRWQSCCNVTDSVLTMEQWGEALFDAHHCAQCHGPDETVGPSLVGIAMQERALEGGGVAIATKEYLARAITDPAHEVPLGYAGRGMPSFGGLGQSQVDALVLYVTTLGADPAATP